MCYNPVHLRHAEALNISLLTTGNTEKNIFFAKVLDN